MVKLPSFDFGVKVFSAKEITIVDTVNYYNLTPGETYTMKGTIMDKATGKAITVNGKKSHINPDSGR